METTSLGLKKPAGTDPVDIRDFNDNTDIIDTALCSRPLKNGNASEMYTKFELAGSLANIVSGEALKTSMGKLMKALGDYFAHKASVIAFIANEGLSIVENLGIMGVPLPKVLKKAIEVLQTKAENGEVQHE